MTSYHFVGSFGSSPHECTEKSEDRKKICSYHPSTSYKIIPRSFKNNIVNDILGAKKGKVSKDGIFIIAVYETKMVVVSLYFL